MTSKERVLAAVNHESPDKVPLDFCSCGQTMIHISVIAGLRDFYGLKKQLVKVDEPYTMMGQMDEDLREAMGVDVNAIPGYNTLFGAGRADWKEYTMEDGNEVLVPGDFNITRDDEGNIFTYPQGDTSVSPSGKMPQGGYYFDTIVRQHPIDDNNLNVEDNLEEFGLISDQDILWLKNEVEKQKATNRAALTAIPGAGLGDIACVPAPWMKDPKGIRSIEDWYMSTVLRLDYLHELFDRQSDIVIQNMEKIFKTLGNDIDIAWICGTDFGTQNTTFCSLETFNDLYKPYYQKMNNWIHKNTEWKTFKHCCGAIENFMEAFIESGFDIMNPVQWTADGMEPEKLKSRYGNRITYWGGGIDTQRTLPFGTKNEIREEVLRVCEIFAKDGGFVFSSIHNIQAATPVENVVAMLDALKEFNG